MSKALTLVSRPQIEQLQAEMLKHSQWDCAGHTKHYFADGIYLRTLWRPAGTVIVGKVHKQDHLYVVAQGTVAVTVNGIVEQLTAPAVIECPAGTKRAVVAITDALCFTVHRAEPNAIDDLVEDDPTAAYDIHNKLKNPALTAPVQREQPCLS